MCIRDSVCALLMLLVAKVKEKHSGRVMEAKVHACLLYTSRCV